VKRGQGILFPEFEECLEMPIKPVNVSSVPQRSPFRYPGGKTWFVPVFREWMNENATNITTLVEPFAGGGIISLTALFEDFVQNVVMVEIDEDVAAVWLSIVNGDAEWLADRIVSFDLTKENAVKELARKPKSTKERAFQTILKNRTIHGGILADGSGFIKHGENGKGIRSRWYPSTIAKRLLDLSDIAHRIDFREEDGLSVIKEHVSNDSAVFFIDPPYTAGGKRAGRRLYKHFDIDHEYLFELCGDIRGDFLMTYDNSEEVKEFASKMNFQTRLIPMNNTHHATVFEMVIGKDLSWMDSV